MRGTNSNHTKIFIDGIDVGDPSTPNGAFDYAHPLTADIQQLEVLRGPQSGLYGSDAIGGVISLVTRKGEGPPRATASIETGPFNTFNQTAGFTGAQDNFNYALNVAHFHAGDVPVTPLQLLPPGQKANGNNYDNMTYSTKLGLDINENWSVNTVVRYTDGTLYFTGDGGFPNVPNATQSRHGVQQLFNRDEAVWSVLDGRIRSYFAVNYAKHATYRVAPALIVPVTETKLKASCRGGRRRSGARPRPGCRSIRLRCPRPCFTSATGATSRATVRCWGSLRPVIRSSICAATMRSTTRSRCLRGSIISSTCTTRIRLAFSHPGSACSVESVWRASA